MIVFDLECRTGGHRFEGWFGSSDQFDAQQARGLVSCPHCHSIDVAKAPMAPNLTRKGNQVVAARPEQTATAVAAVPSPAVPGGTHMVTLPPEAAAMMQAYIRIQTEALKASSWVGSKFADDARAMHYGEKNHAPIHGQTTAKEAHDLIEEGIEIAPILFPLAPSGQVN